MNARRWAAVARQEMAFNLRRPLFWSLLVVVTLLAWGLSNGSVRISSGESTVGGTEAFITSQFAVAQILSLSILTMYTFFVAIAFGMCVIRDDESRSGELIHATPLGAGEYVWGKFAGVAASFGLVLAAHVALTMFFNHGLADAATQEFIGPFGLANYLVPLVLFGLPPLLFLGGTAFAIGERTRQPILVFVVPVGVLLVTLGFLIAWSPTWLDPGINRLLMLIDPSGFRWLSETYLTVDRGVEFYNSARIEADAAFLLSRVLFVLGGLAAVRYSQSRLLDTLRRPGAVGRIAGMLSWRPRRRVPAPPAAADDALGNAAPRSASLGELGMGNRVPGFLFSVATVARSELRELLTRPGIYLFTPLVILQALNNFVTTVGAFDAPLLLTPGNMAVQMLSTLLLLVCLLLLFYTVESLQKEFSDGSAPLFYSTPARTGAILAGKAIGTSLVGVAILGATLFTGVAVLFVRQAFLGSPVSVEIGPFLLVWGLILVPTFVVWTAFVMAVFALTRSRAATYGVGMGVIMWTVFQLVVGEGLSWLTNWMAWGVVSWSDMGPLALNRAPLLLNRAYFLGWAVVFVTLAVRLFGRREWDAQRIVHRLRPRRLAVGMLTLAPALALPLVAGVPLRAWVADSFQGERAELANKNYWRKNVATWRDAPLPYLRHVDLDVDVYPDENRFDVRGSYRIFNGTESPLRRVPVTAKGWDDLQFRLDGQPVESEDREGLHIIDLGRPLLSGEERELGFSYTAYLPRGTTRGGGGLGEFVLPSGVVLTSFGAGFVPWLGFAEGLGIDEDNRYEPREYPDDFYEGITPSGAGTGGPPFTVRMRATVPESMLVNGVGRMLSEEVSDGRRTRVWATDYPVAFFNLVAGRWTEHRNGSVVVYHHPEHTYNIDEISSALAAAHRYYGEWFYEYPWPELKLSEFPNLAGYAQGFATNITFSEGIGFLARSDPRSKTAFLVTAHEAAHQWWGNLVTPGRGPGANVLSEGLSHFSTLLLMDQVFGLGQRIEISRRFEERYGDNRQADAERPMVKIDGQRPGDTTVTYEKGGWVAWMMMRLLGREQMLAGLNSFIAEFNPSADHPVLQDLVAHMRPFAPDAAAYDEFVEQWFFDVVVPEYRVLEVSKARTDNGWRVRARVENIGSGRMPVEISVQRGARFPEIAATGTDVATPFEERRVEIVLSAGESQQVEWTVPFEPERVVVDPDAQVLQLRREQAQAGL